MRQVLMAAALVVTAATAAAQAPTPLAVGAEAPDFSLAGAGRGGVKPAPVRLSELRDQTVVIAFFYRARTKG
jgi:peroxiredoxin